VGWSKAGEIIGLRRREVDLDAGVVRVRKNRLELLERDYAEDKDPKTAAGKRPVVLPPHIVPVLAEHMEAFAGPDRVFVGRTGEPMRGDAIRQAFARARAKIGLCHLTFHDLRHTGNTLAANVGATTADLKLRLGHNSSAAAERYLHTVNGRDRVIAQALSQLAEHGDGSALPHG
jgi:integrase